MTHSIMKALVAKHSNAPAAKLEDEKGQRIEGHDGPGGKGIHVIHPPVLAVLFGIMDIRASRRS